MEPGPAGAGWGLVIPFAGGSLVMLWYLRSPRSIVRLRFRGAVPRWELFADILKVGVPGLVNTAITNLSVVLLTGIAGQLGPEAAIGYAMGAQGHLKVPQVGRVIIQDDVEIGANTTIDRGSGRDTVIGEGTKIDNLVQIGHNVVIGRHCVIVAQVGISGSTTLEDFVVLGGQVGVVGHVRIGMGAQIAGSSNVNKDVPPGARWGGTPAKPMREWFREMTTLKTLASRRVSAKDDETPGDA